MRSTTKPDMNQLSELYAAAVAFKQAQPWNVLCDIDLIAVDNPESGERGYCSIMGHGGMHYGLGVYLGTKGLYGFNQILVHADDMPGLTFLEYQDNIMCSFEDREQLDKTDYDQIKALGLKFRGRNAWPLFRRYEPGFYPWPVNADECVFLTHALRQIPIVVSDLSKGQLRLDSAMKKMILRQARQQDGELVWETHAIEHIRPTRTLHPVQISDETLLGRINNTPARQTILLIDVQYLPEPVQNNKDDRPYFPRLMLIVDKKSDMPIGFEMYQDIERDADVVFDKLVDFILAHGRPAEIHVRGERMPAILADFCQKTGMKLRVLKQMKQYDQMVKTMTSFM
ncbi:MAG: hypothetical protein PHN53_09040 [Eubacteriales bacterium]|nr:hypothetical protein [Eubacteriales bacterium]MDD4744733.1 hypothetical protein [Eubacteriales bacterium]